LHGRPRRPLSTHCVGVILFRRIHAPIAPLTSGRAPEGGLYVSHPPARFSRGTGVHLPMAQSWHISHHSELGAPPLGSGAGGNSKKKRLKQLGPNGHTSSQGDRRPVGQQAPFDKGVVHEHRKHPADQRFGHPDCPAVRHRSERSDEAASQRGRRAGRQQRRISAQWAHHRACDFRWGRRSWRGR